MYPMFSISCLLQMITDMFTCRKHFPVFSSFMTFQRVCIQSTTTGPTSGAGTAYPSGAPEFTTGFYWGSCYYFCVMFCRSLFVVLAIVLSALLRFKDYDNSFGIFTLLTKRNFKKDGQQFHLYQQNEQPPQTIEQLKNQRLSQLSLCHSPFILL